MIRGLRFTTKGGPGSGHHGHAGIPGQVGGSAAGSGGGNMGGGNVAPAKNSVSVDATFPSKLNVDNGIKSGMLEYDNEYILKVGDTVYEVRTEGWWEDCMESRGMGTTSVILIKESFRDIMVSEASWAKADISGYFSKTEQDPTYGVAYIGRELK